MLPENLHRLDEIMININNQLRLPGPLTGHPCGATCSGRAGYKPITAQKALEIFYGTKETIARLQEANDNLMLLIQQALE